MKYRTVLITGVAGFLGSHIAEELIRRNIYVVGIDNFFRGKPENLPAAPRDIFLFYELDLAKIDNVNQIAKILNEHSIELVIHYAAINGTKYFYDIPYKVLSQNIAMTVNLLHAIQMSNAPVKMIVYASSSEVYGEPMKIPTPETHPIVLDIEQHRDSYAASKAIGEFYIKLFSEEMGLDYLILRIFNTYGPRMDTSEYGQVIPEFIRKLLLEEKFTIIGPGTQTRSFCYVEDHVRLVLKLIDIAKNDVFNVGSDEEVTILKLAELMHRLVGKPFKPIILPPRKGDRLRRCPDISKLIKTVDDRPRVPLREGLKRTIAYYARKWGIKIEFREDE